MITHLNPNQVFVFGSNSTGFHGAGAAGYAFRGNADNTWRTDSMFLKAMNSPIGSQDRIGKWAEYGVARGLQYGEEGMSYGIVTIVKPGKKRSIPLWNIQEQFETLFQTALDLPNYDFLMTEVGSTYAGYSRKEMLETWQQAQKNWNAFGNKLPENIILPENYYN